jgi:hypothetical protein
MLRTESINGWAITTNLKIACEFIELVLPFMDYGGGFDVQNTGQLTN